MTTQNEKFAKAMAAMYRLISNADDHISKNEIHTCNQMIETEKLDPQTFGDMVAAYGRLSEQELLYTCIDLLKACTEDEKILCLAWMRKIANSDGYMAPEEWSLIFQVYKRGLNLELKSIVDKSLNDQ